MHSPQAFHPFLCDARSFLLFTMKEFVKKDTIGAAHDFVLLH